MRRVATPMALSSLVVFATLLVSPALAATKTSDPHSTGAVVVIDPLKRGESAPDVDWRRFNQILIHPVQVAYTTDFRLGSVFHRSRFRPQDIDHAQRLFGNAMAKHLGNTYPFTTVPGPNVLRVEAAIVNPVSDRTALYRIGGYVSSRSKISLVVVLRDSENGDYLHNLDIPVATDSLNLSNRGYEPWNYMRLVFSRVVMKLRYTLRDSVEMSGL